MVQPKLRRQFSTWREPIDGNTKLFLTPRGDHFFIEIIQQIEVNSAFPWLGICLCTHWGNSCFVWILICLKWVECSEDPQCLKIYKLHIYVCKKQFSDCLKFCAKLYLFSTSPIFYVKIATSEGWGGGSAYP